MLTRFCSESNNFIVTVLSELKSFYFSELQIYPSKETRVVINEDTENVAGNSTGESRTDTQCLIPKSVSGMYYFFFYKKG